MADGDVVRRVPTEIGTDEPGAGVRPMTEAERAEYVACALERYAQAGSASEGYTGF